MHPFRFQKAYSPVLICNAQGGTLIPGDIPNSMTDAGLQADASRMLIRFVDVSVLERAAVITSNISRHVIDLDRATTDPTIIPAKTSSEERTYHPGITHSQSDVDDRVQSFYIPLHAQIAEELGRLVQQFGKAVLVDITSTASESEPAISVTLAGRNALGKLEELLNNWQCAIKETHNTEVRQALNTGAAGTEIILEETSSGKETRLQSEIISRYAKLENVTAIRVCLNESNFVDPDDGEFDFETGRELIKSVESLMQSIMYWAEK